jgi:hypothetical protein
VAKIAAVVLAVLLVLGGAGAGGYFIYKNQDKHPNDKPTSTAQSKTTKAPTGKSSSTKGSSSPSIAKNSGIEPPKDGTWPTSWPKFDASTKTQAVSNLGNLGLSFLIPDGWQCTKQNVQNTPGAYSCTGKTPSGKSIGGDVIVRECPDLCDSNQRVAMRQAEEAWGLQWTRAGSYLGTWAETSSASGPGTYGLIFIAYWSTQKLKDPNRQVVFRMTAPTDQAATVQKIANSVWDTAKGS